MTSRVVNVDARRLERWVAGFGERHGGPIRVGRMLADDGGSGLVLSAVDGATAVLTPPLPAAEPLDDVPALAAWALLPRRVGAVLVRRGGYACAVVTAETVAASKIGTRYVQGRTAAGGWSQQRFARRRENQTEGLVRSCADVAVRILEPAARSFDALLTGGDRTLVDRVLADLRLAPLTGLPRLPHLAVGDPRSDVVRSLPDRVRSVAVRLDEPG